MIEEQIKYLMEQLDCDKEEIAEELSYLDFEKEDDRDSHRWFDVISGTVKVGDRFFNCVEYHCTGDASWSDMDLEYSLEDVYEVYPVEVTTIAYSSKKPNK